MGARFGFFSKFDENGYQHLLKEGVTVDVGASASAYGITGSLSTKTQTEKDAASKFDSTREGYTIFSVGSKPPSDNNGVTWANQVFTDPMPITYSLATLDALLT
jgi:hypothetical protein